eukprot:24175-Chlamydomonas_euryale.AAC.3
MGRELWGSQHSNFLLPATKRCCFFLRKMSGGINEYYVCMYSGAAHCAIGCWRSSPSVNTHYVQGHGHKSIVA